ncbi:site-specific DNA-methyltransferase [Sphingopyxis sp. GW247-27LB]|uniref:site-specific DNA-methyltransferase n=1 Tax=Sphingopyxis sp. GW247-27LB TaxID=2012632 RepID=UPI000BD70288|nr:site-specific DNA-methyltransferase [Sphingopyxis sp. GW247-27LB]PAL23554.1 site-specific DNA-methyltransferase [Sphingopyxis sp. GW247-27LB]
MSVVTLHEGDNRETLRRLIRQGVRVQSVVCDPPYGLVSIKKRFGAKNAAPAKHGKDGAFARQSAGFMGSQWDGTGIERDPEFWALIYEILLPGGYCVAFSGASTGHWQACAMEMAGFTMHPFLGWVFGSGFPKDHDAAKAIDKALGAQGSVVPSGAAVRRMIPGAQQHATGDWTKTDDRQYQPGQYMPATDEAAAWDGWSYGAQALKPALEPIYVGQKPFSEKNGALNLLKHGVGAVNIDGCRVQTDDDLNGGAYSDERKPSDSDWVKHGGTIHSSTGQPFLQPVGRHPANLITDRSDSVRALFPDSKGQQAAIRGTEPSRTGQAGTACYGEYGAREPTPVRSDSDTSAARFFNAFPLDAEAIYYHAKASKRDRIYECRTCGQHVAGAKPDCGCTPTDIRTHPTVKPEGLMEHLVRLVTPPGGTVLDPFAGTGTTGRAAQNIGVDAILMEADPDFCRDIRLRCGIPAPVNTGETDDLESLIGGGLHDNLEDLIG